MLRDFVIAIILFGGIMTGYFIFLNGFLENYDVEMGGVLDTVYDSVNETMASTYDINDNITQKLETSEGASASTGADTSMLSVSVFEAIKMPINVFLTLPKLIFAIIDTFLPGGVWFATMVLSIIGVLVAFWIVSAIRGKDV